MKKVPVTAIIILVGVIISGALILYSCDLSALFDPGAIMDRRDPRYRDQEHVIVQVCEPSKIVDPLNDNSRSGLVVEEVADTNKGHAINVGSLGSADIYFVGTTTRNQPVYAEEWDERQRDTIAIAVRTPAADYWFKLPKVISRDRFTNWQSPVSEEGKAEQEKERSNPAGSTGFRLLYGKEINYYPVGQYAPKMRFRIMSVRDYGSSNRIAAALAEPIPACESNMENKDPH